MNDIKLTREGRELLLRANTSAGSEINWIGYFGLAYVPDQSNFNPDSSTLIDAKNGEKGDYIYNIWQGDLFSEGHMIDSGRALTLYDRNISSNFKYVYNREKGCNQLVTWTCGDGNADGSTGEETPTYIRTGFKVYEGVKMGDGNNVGNVTDSEIPCPAPLVYLGNNKSYTSPVTGWGSLTDIIGNDWPMDKKAIDEERHPMVTPDMRFYHGNVELVNDTDFDAQPDGTVDPFGVIASPNTRSEYTLNQFGEFVSVSNFNKGHGHVSSEGYGMYTQDSCHNMSQVTRLFPIAKYEIESTQPSTDDSNTKTDDATTIKYHIELNLNAAYAAEQEYEKTLQYQAPQSSDTVSEEEQADEEIFVGHHPNSFKFNRIGIYAVQATLRHFIRESDSGNNCSQSLYQVEISPDSTPVLFAVINVDEQYISEDTTKSYSTDFALKLLDGEGNGICKNPEVYYNLAENEAITWYQNQLLATAGLSEAIVGLGVNVAHLMNREGGNNSQCPSGSSSLDGTEYAPKSHTHDYMRNLVDGKVNSGAVRGINTLPEGDGTTVGEDSLILGKNTAGAGKRMLIQGEYAEFDDTCDYTTALGVSNVKASNVRQSLLIGTYSINSDPIIDIAEACLTGTWYTLKKVSDSLLVGSGAHVGKVYTNNIDENDHVIGEKSTTQNIIAALSGATIPPGCSNSLVIAGGAQMPSALSNSIVVSNTGSVFNEDILMSAEEFNAKCEDLSIFDAGTKWYVLQTTDIGDHYIKVYNPTTGQNDTSVELAESVGTGCTHYNAGVHVDASTQRITYTPYIDRRINIMGFSTTNPGYGPYVRGARVVEGGQGKASQYRANPHTLRYSILMGGGLCPAGNMRNSLIMSSGTDLRHFDVNDCIIMGDAAIFVTDVPNKARDWDENNNEIAVNHRLTNVKVFDSLGSDMLSSLATANDDFSTAHYSDALIFLNNGYNTPETLGIFRNPMYYTEYKPDEANPSAARLVTIDKEHSYFYVHPDKFDANGEYQPDSDDPNKMFKNYTKRMIAAAINKPAAPMIYTGGICLAGKPNGTTVENKEEANAGLIKIGSGVVPCAYIVTHPISEWSDGGHIIHPISVSGTTDCPYKGMALCVTDVQEPDGTLHLALYRGLDEAPSVVGYEYDTDTDTFTADETGVQLTARRDKIVKMIGYKTRMYPVLSITIKYETDPLILYANLAFIDRSGGNDIAVFRVNRRTTETLIPNSNRIDVDLSTGDISFNTTPADQLP